MNQVPKYPETDFWDIYLGIAKLSVPNIYWQAVAYDDQENNHQAHFSSDFCGATCGDISIEQDA